MGLRYTDVETYVKAGLTELGYGTANPDTNEAVRTMPAFHPGPLSAERLQKISPSAMLFLVVGDGAGLTSEAAYDRPFITVRVVGLQNNFDYAETLAYDVDRLLLDVANGVNMGDARTLYVNRTGGAPRPVDYDAGDRFHFQATYITEAMR